MLQTAYNLTVAFKKFIWLLILGISNNFKKCYNWIEIFKRGDYNLLIPSHNLFIGQKGKIIQLNFEDESTKNRLLAMGITPGKFIELVHVSPFGDPLVFKIGEKKVVLRKGEASKIFADVPYKIFNLLECEIGRYEIIDIKGGRNFLEEMKSMGLYEGVNINIIHKLGNKIIIEVEGNKQELGRGRATKILCKKVEWKNGYIGFRKIHEKE